MSDTEMMQHEESTQVMTVAGVHRQVQLIQEIMKSEMKKDEHYGIIPGCGDKKSLKKSGAEKLNLLFRMAPRYKTEFVDLGNGHREYRIVTELYSNVTGKFLGEGLGSCSTMEAKYRYRNSARQCPECQSEAIIKGREEYGGGWVCFAKKGGCGAKFIDGDPIIENQPSGKFENPDIADTYNTCLKMGKKRSLVDAVLTVTAASDIFAQDLDEDEDAAVPGTPPIPFGEPAPAAQTQPPIATPQAVGQNQAKDAPKGALPPVPANAREMISKRESKCDTCGKQILIGQKIVYSASANRAYHREHYAA